MQSSRRYGGLELWSGLGGRRCREPLGCRPFASRAWAVLLFAAYTSPPTRSAGCTAVLGAPRRGSASGPLQPLAADGDGAGGTWSHPVGRGHRARARDRQVLDWKLSNVSHCLAYATPRLVYEFRYVPRRIFFCRCGKILWFLVTLPRLGSHCRV